MSNEQSGDLSQKGVFSVGSRIKCRYKGNQVEGDVAGFHSVARLLMIRAPASDGKSSHNDIFIINADSVDKISVDDRSTPELLKPINFQKLEKRRVKACGTKKSQILALSADVAPEGRQLFLTIIKTFDEVDWDGKNIIVLSEVKITPPYRAENVHGLTDKEASVVLVRKIVDKHWADQQSASTTPP